MTAVAVARAQEGDRDALRFLYERYSHNVYGYVRSIVRDDHEAEDITQLVFAKLMTALVKYDERGVPFFAWLRRLARNLAIDHMRGLRVPPADDEPVADTHDQQLVIDRTLNLHDALATLPLAERNVVVLRHLVGLTSVEIAQRLGRSESSIKSLHQRGRFALRRELVRLESAPVTSAAA